MKLIGPINSGDSTGGAGLSTANANTTTIVSGVIYGIYIKYNGSPPAGTTDVVISTTGTSPAPPSNTILTITDSATAAWYYPRHVVHDETGTAITYDGTRDVHQAVPIHDTVNVKIDQANDADSIDVWLLLED